MPLSVETLNAITRDIIMGTSVARSRLTYTDEMRQVRRDMTRRWSEWLVDHPDAVLTFPEELEVDPKEPDPRFEVGEDGTLRPVNRVARQILAEP